MNRSYLQKIISKLTALGSFNFLPDNLYLKLAYWARVGRKLHLDNPISLNEKVQWLKLYDRKDYYKKIVDKYAVRLFIKDKLGGEYLIPLVGGPWNSFEEINFDSLPSSFVLKTTHDSGGVVVVSDINKIDIKQVRKRLTDSMNNNYFYPNREWPYKDIPHQIIAEQYLVDDSGT